MCDKCVEVDKKIDRYRKILKQVSDEPSRERLQQFIAECVGEKIGFHTESHTRPSQKNP
jgi:hypothetical protein